MRFRVLLGVVLVAACKGGGGAPGSVNPQTASPTAESAVRSFLKAASDSNIEQMAMLWGTDKGSAFSTHQPSDYLKRLQVIQLYLRNIDYTVGKIHPSDNDASKMVVDVVIDRKSCLRTMPVTTVQTSKSGWLVNLLDLNTAGNPSRPCRDAGGDALPAKQ